MSESEFTFSGPILNPLLFVFVNLNAGVDQHDQALDDTEASVGISVRLLFKDIIVGIVI